MLSTISIQEAQAHLAELMARLAPGDELVITENEKPVARIVMEQRRARSPRRPGTAAGKLLIHSEDEEHLKDFEDYME
jgi:antitoxin (DNA-binding transcriptional repressor) of toxin-antitoxin stability system